jgi:exopolysaccharide biosynthesis protein
MIKMILVTFIIFQLNPANPNYLYAENEKNRLISTEMITSGAILKKYNLNFARNQQEITVNAHVVEVDLNNPYIRLDAIAGVNQQFTKKETISNMMNGAGAVAGVNGDFYNTLAEGAPEGPQISSNQLLATTPEITGLYAFAINNQNKPIIDAFAFQGKIMTSDGESYKLGGINKTYYWGDSGQHSHIDSMFMYTSAWGSIQRSNDGVTFPSEILVRNQKIEYIGIDEVIQSAPPVDGYILRTSGKATEFVKKHMKIGDEIKAEYKLYPIDASSNEKPMEFKMMIGGNTLLVHDGAPSVYTRNISGIDGYRFRSRSAIGYSKDLSKVYLITVDNNGNSKGMNIRELQQFMVDIGVWRGMALDGGGSTQLVTRPLGEFKTKLANKTETGAERKVVNGVGIFSTAPKGELDGLVIQGPQEVFMNEPYIFTLGAYDQFYNPLTVNSEEAEWSVNNQQTPSINQAITIISSGVARIKAKIGNIFTETDLQVIDRAYIKEMKIILSDSIMMEGGTYKLDTQVTTKTGKKWIVPHHQLKWEVFGAEVEIDQGLLKVKKINNPTNIQIVAQFDGYSSMMTVPIGESKLWYDLDKVSVLTSAKQQSIEGTTSVEIVRSSSTNNQSLRLNYDFPITSDPKKAIASFGTEKGEAIEGIPQSVKLNLELNGSPSEVYAEFIDSNKRTYLVDLKQGKEWTGWKEVVVDLGKYKMKSPLYFKSIAVSASQPTEDENRVKGNISFDDIKWIYPKSNSKASMNSVALKLNEKKVSINQKPYLLEQAPILIHEKTMIPIRFIAQASGGELKWYEEDRKISVRTESKFIELWIDQLVINVNGKKIDLEVAPQIVNQQTMVPLRQIAESLGWELKWNDKNHTIQLK